MKGDLNMDKESLIKIAKELHQSALDANAYCQVLQQYHKNLQNYTAEMRLSYAFYHTIHDALIKACFMEIAKLYDSTPNAASVGTLLSECEHNPDLFPKYRETMTIECEGKTIALNFPYSHRLTPKEECFFKDQVDRDRKLFASFDIPDAPNMPIDVDLTFPDLLNLYQNRFSALGKKVKVIRFQRNKYYAHNDEKCILSSENPKRTQPIAYSDIEELIDFALGCTDFILGILTDTNCYRSCANINDWTKTLMMTRIGMKQQKYELQEAMKTSKMTP